MSALTSILPSQTSFTKVKSSSHFPKASTCPIISLGVRTKPRSRGNFTQIIQIGQIAGGGTRWAAVGRSKGSGLLAFGLGLGQEVSQQDVEQCRVGAVFEHHVGVVKGLHLHKTSRG